MECGDWGLGDPGKHVERLSGEIEVRSRRTLKEGQEDQALVQKPWRGHHWF